MPKPHLPIVVAVAVQIIEMLIILVAPFGFDHPSSLGLDYSHFLMLFVLYCLALAFGIYLALQQSRWTLALLQILIGVVFATQVFPMPWGNWPSSNQGTIAPAEESRP